MNKQRVAVVGYGNIGRWAVEGVQVAPDLELAGIVRRKGGGPAGVPMVGDIRQLGPVDAALLCVPTRQVEETAKLYLSMGISTVDSFDIHGEIPALRRSLEEAARAGGAVSVLSAGWDPGSDSVVRALLEACAPKGITDTNFGPGMSMGHSVAAKSVEGVAAALSTTIPLGSGVHRRVVYVQPQPGADFGRIEAAIKADPYFAQDETHVIPVEDVDALLDMGHSVHLTRKGVSASCHNQHFSFSMRVHNPALTAQIMVSCARAASRLDPGAYTLIQIPVVHLLPGEAESWIRKLV